MAQGAPRNWFGRQFSLLIRKLVLTWARLPIDAAVGAVKMRCYLRDNVSERKFVFMPQRFDPRERALLMDELPHDGVFIDIGANVGIYTLSAATHLGARGRIVALEPNPPVFERLCFNIKATRSGRDDWPQIDALQIGVADAAGERRLYLDAGNLGGSSILAAIDPDKPGREAVTIICKPLLEILSELSVERIDALKIDIEGAEDLALIPYLMEGPDENLARCMIIENSEQLWKGDLVGALGDRGYTVTMRSRRNTVYSRVQ